MEFVYCMQFPTKYAKCAKMKVTVFIGKICLLSLLRIDKSLDNGLNVYSKKNYPHFIFVNCFTIEQRTGLELSSI